MLRRGIAFGCVFVGCGALPKGEIRENGDARMKRSFPRLEAGGHILSQSLSALREKCGKTQQSIAESMGMQLRSYQEFESGRGPQSLERIFSFADATACDPHAILIGALLGLPDLALYSADNKFCLILIAGIVDFYEREGADLGYIEPRTLITAITHMFKSLSQELEKDGKFFQAYVDKARTVFDLKNTLFRKPRPDPSKK